MNPNASTPRAGNPNPMAARIRYCNHRGETRWRTIVAQCLRYGASEWHDGHQWLLEAFDFEKGAKRTFAAAQILRWEPAAPPRRPDAAPVFARPAASAAGENDPTAPGEPEIDKTLDANLRRVDAMVEALKARRAEAAILERFENVGGFVLHQVGGEAFLVFADGIARASAVLAVRRDGEHILVTFEEESMSFRPWPREEAPEPSAVRRAWDEGELVAVNHAAPVAR